MHILSTKKYLVGATTKYYANNLLVAIPHLYTSHSLFPKHPKAVTGMAGIRKSRTFTEIKIQGCRVFFFFLCVCVGGLNLIKSRFYYCLRLI